MRRNNNRTQPLVAPLKYVKGSENLDVANSILRAEMKSQPKKSGKEKKAVAARSSKRRSASIERIFDKKKPDEEKKKVDDLKHQLSQLKERENQLSRVRSSSISNKKQTVNLTEEKNVHKDIDDQKVEALTPPPPPPPPPVQQIPSYKPVQEPTHAHQQTVPSERKGLKRFGSENGKKQEDESFYDLINQTMADRRKYLAPESDSDDDDDETEETEF